MVGRLRVQFYNIKYQDSFVISIKLVCSIIAKKNVLFKTTRLDKSGGLLTRFDFLK